MNGTQLWDLLQNSFAWVATTGYTSKANVTTQFPIVVGEFGSSFANLAVSVTLRNVLKQCQTQSNNHSCSSLCIFALRNT